MCLMRARWSAVGSGIGAGSEPCEEDVCGSSSEGVVGGLLEVYCNGSSASTRVGRIGRRMCRRNPERRSRRTLGAYDAESAASWPSV